MLCVRLINIMRDFPFARQLPGDFTNTYGVNFVWNDEGQGEEYLVCYDELKSSIETTVPRERRLLFIGEPPCITRYPAEYLNLFGTVVCAYDLPKFHGRHIRTHSSLWWFYGMNPKDVRNSPVLHWDELAVMAVPNKTGEISTVCGNKSWCMMHKRRRTLTETLAQHFGDRLAVFGPGYRPVPDKKDAIDPYRYHIAVENNSEPGFWTEKLADAFLGYALPIYVGGADVEHDFPEGSLLRIDPFRPTKAIEMIEKALHENLWEQRLPLICAAREKILREHNLFFCVQNIIKTMPTLEVLPPLTSSETLPDFNSIRHAYHFREHLNHQAFKYLPIRKPLFPL